MDYILEITECLKIEQKINFAFDDPFLICNDIEINVREAISYLSFDSFMHKVCNAWNNYHVYHRH